MKKVNDDNLLRIDKEEIMQHYLGYLQNKFEKYFNTTIEVPQDDVTISEDSMLDSEHVSGILRYLIGENDILSNSVGIFPVYDEYEFLLIAREALQNSILHNPPPHLANYTQALSPLEERSKIIDPNLLKKRDAEEKRRNALNLEFNKVTDKILNENKISKDTALFLHLESITSSENYYLGNRTKNNVFFGNCDQYIIPFRMDYHFTVAIAQKVKETPDEKHILIQYYDSLGGNLNKRHKQQFANFFHGIGFTTVLYTCKSNKDQQNDNNCGIFSAFKAFDIVNKKIGANEFLLNDLSDYKKLFYYFRYRVVDMLLESGCNISLSPEFYKKLSAELKEHEQTNELDADNEHKNISYRYNFLSWIGFKRLRTEVIETQNHDKKEYALAPLLSKTDSGKKKVLISNRYWTQPSLSQHDPSFQKEFKNEPEMKSDDMTKISSPERKKRKYNSN